MIHLENKAKIYWDLAILFTTIAAALVIPVSVVFGSTVKLLPILATVISTTAFIADIVINFNTSFHFQGKIIENKRAIARRYFQGWFAVDLIAALPFGIILSIVSTPAESALHLLRILALIKLFRVAKTMQRIGGRNVNPAILRLFLLVFWILLAAHVVSCGWIFIIDMPDEMKPYEEYIDAFYWTITTLTTIGYGDRLPTTTLQILFVILIEILGAGMYGLVIGNIANLIANIDVAKTQYKEKLDKINTFLKYRSIPYNLQRKINDYYNYLWESRRGYDESSVLADLPGTLKESVSLYLNKEIIEKVPIFEADVWDHVDMTQLAHCLRAPCQGIALDHLGHAHAFGREQGLVGFAESMAQGIGREPLLELGVVAVRGQMRQVGGKPEQPVETGLLGRAVGDP